MLCSLSEGGFHCILVGIHGLYLSNCLGDSCTFFIYCLVPFYSSCKGKQIKVMFHSDTSGFSIRI